MKKKICFIFARKGSIRLKNKNLKLLNKKPLIYHSINTAKKSKLFNDIYVSTDSAKIANYAKKLNVQIIKRPKHLSSKNAVEFLAWKHAVNFIEKKKINFDIFVSLPCTAPLRKVNDIKNCLSKLKKKNQLVMTCYDLGLFDNLIIKKSKNNLKYLSNTTTFDEKKKFFY